MTHSEDIIRIRTNHSGADGARNPAPTIWSELRRLRRATGDDVTDLAEKSGLSITTVESIEAGAVERLPIGDAGRREVVRLCEALGADPDPYLEAMRERSRGPALGRKFERQRPQRRRSRVVVFGLVWALVAAGFVAAWLLRRGEDRPSELQTDVAAPISAPASVPQTTTSTTAAPATAPLGTEGPAGAGGPVEVTVLAARDDVWVQATVDGEKVLAGLLRRGESETWRGTEIALVLGRPSAVDVTVDGEPRASAANMALP